MNKPTILLQFEQMLKNRFPNRAKPISKELPPLEAVKFNDEKFDRWRKGK